MSREYKTLKNQIMELWRSRGLDVKTISFRILENNEYQ